MNQEIIDSHQTMNGFDAREPIARGQALQQVRSAFCTAVSVQKPRDVASVKRELIKEAMLMGQDAYYGWGAGKSAIEGPSIDLAVAAARCWGNCVTDIMPVQDLPDCWIFTAVFIDLETGYTRTRQFRQAKDWNVHGRHDDERKMDMRFQIGQSKAERNVILKALPSWLINAALDAAKEGVRQELENLTKKHGLVFVADRLVAALMKCGVKESAIMKKCAIAERKGLTVEHLVILRGDLNAIQSGQERAEVLFPNMNEAEPTQHSVDVQPADQQEAEQVPAATEVKKPGKKVTKKTLMLLNDFASKLQVSPPDKQRLCDQVGAQTFEELSEENAQAIIADLNDQLRVRQEQSQREPGDDADEGS